MKKIKLRSACPVSYSLDIFGDRWTLLILRDMIFHGKSSYGEFLESEEKIATNILADRLSTLESEGFISKKVSPHNKSKFIYSLTEKAADMVPVIIEMVIWGSKHNPDCVPAGLLAKIASSKTRTIKEYIDKVSNNMQV